MKKRLMSLLLCLTMALAWLPAGSPASAAESSPFDGGSGTAEDPYLVSTAEQLQEVRNYSGSCFLQVNDIDLSGSSYMPPLSIAAGGVYDGGGNCITGYKASSALFFSNSGTIQNLGLRDSEITYVSSPSGQHLTYTIGGLVGTNNGTIHNCYVDHMDMSVSISMQATHSFSSLILNVGGMVGINSGTISCCYITGSVSGYGSCKKYNIAGAEAGASVYVGGISGRNRTRINESGVINNCYSMAGVTGGTSGVLSGFNGATITKCYCSNGSRGTGSGADSTDITYKSTDEMRSSAFAFELTGNCPDCSWEQKMNSNWEVQVVQTMQNLTVSTDHPSGTYDMPIEVEITSDRSPVFDLLYYTIDGVTQDRQPYDGPITLEQDAVIRVYAVHSDNPKVFRVSTLRYKAAQYPVQAAPAAGTYTSVPQQITLTTQTPDAQIYYTTDGSDPISSGTSYGGPFFLFKNTTVTAAAKVGDEWGDPLSFTYKISPEIAVSQPEGQYTEPFVLELESSVPQYEVYYTVDGYSDPTVSGTKYDPGQGIELYKTTTLKVASTFEGEWSDVATFQYDFPEPVITPSAEPGEYDDVVRLTLTCDTPYVSLSYYAPGLTALETAYEPGDTIDIYKSAKLTVYARYNGQFVTREDWTYTLPEPEITAEPETGTYNQSQTIALSSSIPSYQLYYTLDMSDPGEKGMLYTEPFELDHTATVKVCAKYGEIEVADAQFSYSLSLPYVTASPGAGDVKAPLDITLTAPNAFYSIYYTTDGSNPKTSPTRLKYEGPIHVEYPAPLNIRAVPELSGTYGTVSEFRYTFSSQSLAVAWEGVEKRVDYEIALTVSNTLPEDKSVDFCAAAYQDGKMLGAAVEQVELPQGTEKKDVTISYPCAGLLPEDAALKVFCLDSVTRQPYCEAAEYPVSQIPVIYELDSLTARPTAIEGYEGDVISVELTAHYLNGKADQTVNPYSYSSGNSYVARASSGYVTLVAEGSTTVTYTYTAGGVAKSVEIPVTVKAPTYNLGFLADPTADELPADAIPISSQGELAALDQSDTAGKTFYLTQDIQLTGEWSPVYGFQGTLDGRGHTVSGLYISSASKKRLAGLFASAYDATIKNLAVEIDARGVSAYHGSDVSYAGGLVGHSNNTNYINCYTTGGPVSASGMAPYAGGLVGYLMNQPENQVTNCFSNCEVSSKSTQATTSNTCMAGGLIGELESGDGYQATAISRCYATGNISLSYPGGSSGRAGTQAGGLLGGGIRLEVRDCFALGDVTARRTGISTGSSLFAGGLGGWLIQTELTRCYAAGDVSGGSKSYVGGLTAAAATINSCYRVGQSVTGTEYYNGGTLVTVPYAQSSYSGFDFTSTWQFTQGAFQGLPHLQYQD